jgi:integrase
MAISVDTLKDRLEVRKGTFRLDLRSKAFPKHRQNRAVLRDPAAPNWPAAGNTTSDEATAHSWLHRYASLLNAELQAEAAQKVQNTGPLFVAAAGEEYVAHLERTLGLDHNTTINRRSCIGVHIAPKLGELLLSSLDSLAVQRFLDGLIVTKQKHGKKWQEEAALKTKTAVKAALREIWRFHYASNPPFDGVRLTDRKRVAAQRQAIKAGNFEDLLPREGFVPDEIERLLVRAAMIDMERKPNIALSNTAYTAVAIALQYGLYTRVAELCLMRMKCIEQADNLMLIPGTKNQNALRWAVVFDSVWPWVEEAMRMAGSARGPMNWLIRVDPRAGGEMRQPAITTIQSRINAVMAAEGLKLPNKTTHVLRASALTTLVGEGMARDRAKMIMGHAVLGGATDKYLLREELLRTIAPTDRFHLRTLPSPEAVRQKAEEALALATENQR